MDRQFALMKQLCELFELDYRCVWSLKIDATVGQPVTYTVQYSRRPSDADHIEAKQGNGQPA